MACRASAVAVRAAGVHRGRVVWAGGADKLPQAVAEVLHLAGAQHTAHTQELGSGPAGTQVSAGAIPERLTHSRGQAGTPLGLEGLVQLPDHRPGCRVPGLQATVRSLGWGLPAEGDGGSKPGRPAFQGPINPPTFPSTQAWGHGQGKPTELRAQGLALSHSVAHLPAPPWARGSPGLCGPLSSGLR